MKAKRIFITGMILVVFFSVSSCFSMSGDVKKEKRDVGTFEQIGLSISADLYLTQGTVTEVIIEGPDNVLEEIKTEVSNGKLTIRYDNRIFSNYPRIKVYITVPVITGLSISGSGDIIAESSIETDDIDFRISGSGDINLGDLKAENATVGISGSGSVTLSGSGNLKNLKLSISGSGNLDSENLATDSFTAKISGSGNCRVQVNSTLKASVSGSGKVYYSGRPVIDASISGSGKVLSIK
jgi:hypothetical protein